MKFAIIGLGYFGSALAKELSEAGHEVIAIDTDPLHLQKIQDSTALAAEADGTDLEALRQLDVGGADAAIVAIGEGFEASLMITAHCQALGVQRVYTRVINEVHDRLLGLMKVAGKIRAEELAAANFAQQLTNEAVQRYFGLDADHGIVEIEIPDLLKGKTLGESDLRGRFGLNVVTVRRPRAQHVGPLSIPEKAFVVMGTPRPETELRAGDHLVVFGNLKDISKFCGEHQRGLSQKK